MSDPALDTLLEALRQTPGDKLLVADEQLDCPSLLQLKAIPGLHLLTNRQDVAMGARDAGINCIFNDMDLSAWPEKFALISYRVSKEKAVVHHVINQAPHHLLPGGELVLTGYKNEGTKTYISKAEHYLNCKAEVSKGERQLQTAVFHPGLPGEPLDDRDYGELQLIAQPDNLRIFSKPGQYGWSKVDEGSAILIDCLRQQIQLHTEAPASALDLGCGYGYLGLMAARLGVRHITATDNNAAAVFSCRHNFSINQINGEVIADNCADSIHHQFDLVLCNPPFHRGFDTEKSLTEQFAASASHHLKKNGYALFVVNQFIALESIATPYFQAMEILYRDKSFKVIKLTC